MIIDWTFIIPILFGAIFSFIISFYFFREQQKTDFKNMSERISDAIAAITLSSEKIDKIPIDRNNELSTGISRISDQMKSLEASLDRQLRDFVSDVRREQTKNSVETKLNMNKAIDDSRKVLEDAVRNEILMMSKRPNEQNNVISTLVDLIRHSMKTMGEYQSMSIGTMSDKMISDIEKRISSPVDKLSEEISDLKKDVDNIAIMLLPPNQQ